MNESAQDTNGTAPTGTEVEPRPVVQQLSAFDFLLREDDAASDSGERAVYAARPSAFDFSDRPEQVKPRATPLEWIALALAVLVPPLGLVLSIIAGFVSRAKRGWTTWVVRTATVLGVILTIAVIVGGVVLDAIGRSEAAEAKIVADSAPFCASLDTTPGILEAPAFGWPTEPTTIDETVVAMKAYQLRWKELADIAPAGISSGTRSIAFAAQSLVTAVESTKVIDRTGNLSHMKAITAAAGIPAWVARYCG
ncbi:hypothetical protein EYE40_01415 [Glaciihabitans arcticus]|uniref:Uncharacterized protein n=1 Tax=Glaciihabitans arcticus TaxID=2668039 RepID=A0A4V2JEN2_9MICO|nr:hypothetical protein [Glaciihabitans arcticus]TBN56159.1 hypothetical protein EYE40_01415 [Glaciihabitans arcticus]